VVRPVIGILLSASSLVTAVGSLMLACFILQRDHTQRINRIASALFFFVAMYFFAEFQYRSAEGVVRASFWLDLAAPAYPATAFLLHFVMHSTRYDRYRGSRALLLGVHASAGVLTILHPLYNLMGVIKMGSAGVWVRDTTQLHSLGTLAYAWVVAVSVLTLLIGLHHYWRMPSPSARHLRRYRLLGIIAPALVVVIVENLPGLLGAYEHRLASFYMPLAEVALFYRVIRNRVVALTPELVSREIVNSMSESLLLVDTQGIVRAVNPATVRLTGHSDLDLVGEPLAALTGLPWSESELLAEELLLNAHDGSQIPVLFSRATVRGREGEVLAVVCTAVDNTERHKSDAALRSALESAEMATQAKSEFLATMSHELRTPMNAIIGMTSLLQDTEMTKRQREFVDTAHTSGATLLALINDILDYSKLEADRIELESIPFELRAVVEESLELLAAKASQKDLQLSVWIEDGVPETVRGDPTRLRQILINLITNAVKFTEVGEIVVTVRSSAWSEGRHKLLFAVRDTGIGIPEDRRDRLFQSFSQVDSSINRTHGGTGLGLAICQRLVTCMGGRIQVESETGVGSTFQFTLVFEVNGPTRLKLIRAPSALTYRRALVLERDGTWRRILSHQLKSWGLTCTTHGDANEALSALSSDAYDLIVAGRELIDDAQLAALTSRDAHLVLICPVGCTRSTTGAAEVLRRPVKKSVLKSTLRGLFVEVSEPPQPVKRRSQPAAKPMPSMRILLAEDHLVNQKVALNMLQRWGLTADIAANGREALEACERTTYDVVLMDVMMPEMDGLEATRRLRRRYPVGSLQIIAVTANAMAGDRDRCFEAGVDDYISKPILTDCLETALKNAAERLGLSAA